MIQPCMASSIQFISNAPARRREICRLLDWTNLIRISTDSTRHSEATHMTLNNCNPLMVPQLVNTFNRPAPGTARVLVKKVPCHLISVHLATELNVPDCLKFRRFECSNPLGFLTVYSKIQLLKMTTNNLHGGLPITNVGLVLQITPKPCPDLSCRRSCSR